MQALLVKLGILGVHLVLTVVGLLLANLMLKILPRENEGEIGFNNLLEVHIVVNKFVEESFIG